MSKDSREIVRYEIVEDDLRVTLADGARYIARGFCGTPSAAEAAEDIQASGYDFDDAAAQYWFDREAG